MVGKSDDITGQAIFAFVILKAGHEPSDALALQLREHVACEIGPIARPKYLLLTPDLRKCDGRRGAGHPGGCQRRLRYSRIERQEAGRRRT